MVRPSSASALSIVVAAAMLWLSSARAQEREPAWEAQGTTPEAEVSETEGVEPREEEAPEEEAPEEEAPEGEEGEGDTAEQDAAARHRAIRNCHTCNHGVLRFDISLPLMLPFVGAKAMPDDDSEAIIEFDTGLTFGASLGLELRTGPVTTEVSAIGLGLGSQRLTDRMGREIAEIDVLAMLGHASLLWNAPTIPLGSGSSSPRLALWPFAGARVLLMNGTVDAMRRDLDETLVKVDPLVGLETVLDFAGPWSLELRLSVGGFTIGNDISLLGDLNVQHRFTHWFLMRFGYFAFYATDAHTSQTLFNNFEFFLHGPVLAFHITFQ